MSDAAERDEGERSSVTLEAGPRTQRTALGTTDAGRLASVDGFGRLHAVDGSWSVTWWVGADDRWHLPDEDSAVRQRFVEAAPVTETAMRVPSGDAVARAYGAKGPGPAGAVVAFEVANDSTLPFALALVVSSRGSVTASGTTVTIDGATTLHLGRPPSRCATGDDLEVVRAVVVDGAAGSYDAAATAEGRVVALLFPLAHTARLRAAVGPVAEAPAPTDPAAPTSRVDPTALPDAEAVARGWRAHVDRAFRVRLPDDLWAELIPRLRAELLLASAGPFDDWLTADLAGLIAALSRQGFADEARRLVPELMGRQRLTGHFGRGGNARQDTAAALLALGEQWRCAPDPALAADLAGPVAKAAHKLARKQGGVLPRPLLAEALVAAADVLDGGDQPEAAQAVRVTATERVDRTEDPDPLGGPPLRRSASHPLAYDPFPVDQLVTRERDLERLGESYGYRTVHVHAHLLGRVRCWLIGDRPPRDAGDIAALALVPEWREQWRGKPLELHDAPTRFGLLSVALRWHGRRPALLWELEPWPHAAEWPVTFVAPALDLAWRSAERNGEALLHEPPPPPVPPTEPPVGGSFS